MYNSWHIIVCISVTLYLVVLMLMGKEYNWNSMCYAVLYTNQVRLTQMPFIFLQIIAQSTVLSIIFNFTSNYRPFLIDYNNPSKETQFYSKQYFIYVNIILLFFKYIFVCMNYVLFVSFYITNFKQKTKIYIYNRNNKSYLSLFDIFLYQHSEK